MNILLFDIGGTKTRVAMTRNGRSFGRSVIVPTPGHFGDGVAALVHAAQKLGGSQSLTRVVGGIAGTFDRGRGHLVQSPLFGWIGKPLRSTLAKHFRVPVTLENDSALVGLGEATFGSGRGFRIVAYLTVSTGVGGARIVDGKIDANALGFEPGHQILDLHGSPCAQCGHLGDLQSLIGGRELEARVGRPPKRIRSRRVWDEEAHVLSLGLVNATVFWSPEVIVLGGSMFKKPGIAIPRVRQFFGEHLRVFPKAPKLVRGTLGEFGGLFGALTLVRRVSGTTLR